jgi:hypothetical protein
MVPGNSEEHYVPSETALREQTLQELREEYDIPDTVGERVRMLYSDYGIDRKILK